MPHIPAVSVCLTCGVRCAGDVLKGYWEWWHLSVEEIGHDPQPGPDQVVPYVSQQVEVTALEPRIYPADGHITVKGGLEIPIHRIRIDHKEP